MLDTPMIQPGDRFSATLDDLVERIRTALPAEGLTAMPTDLTEENLKQLLVEARRLVDATPLDERLAVKTRLFEARHPFYRTTMSALPAADRHLKPFDTTNSGTLEFHEIEFHMRDSFDKTPREARKFTRMLFWVKMRRWHSIDISACGRLARHASGSGNWDVDGAINQARVEENRRFFANHRVPFSSAALDDLIENNTAPHRNPGATWLARRIGRRVAKREYSLAWRKAGVQRDDGILVISEPIYDMNVDGTLMPMLFNPRQEAETIFRWRRDGVLRHR
jgi:hypothetical protein